MSGSDDGLADGEAEPLGEAEGLAAVFAATVMDDWKAVASCSLVKHSSWVPSASSTQASEAWLVTCRSSSAACASAWSAPQP